MLLCLFSFSLATNAEVYRAWTDIFLAFYYLLIVVCKYQLSLLHLVTYLTKAMLWLQGDAADEDVEGEEGEEEEDEEEDIGEVGGEGEGEDEDDGDDGEEGDDDEEGGEGGEEEDGEDDDDEEVS